ncbi:hypothetical protein M8C21_028850, partial [Ambrosia artemisiifolia]
FFNIHAHFFLFTQVSVSDLCHHRPPPPPPDRRPTTSLNLDCERLSSVRLHVIIYIAVNLKMGRLKLQPGINAIEEEPEEYENAISDRDKAALGCMINSEIGAVLAVMRRNVRWGGRYMSGDDQLEHTLI